MNLDRQKSQNAIAIKTAKGDGTPTDDQVAVINTFTLKPYTAEQLYVREFAVCHNCIDRDRETIDEGLLDILAATLPGKGLFVRHPGGWGGDSGPGEGRWFASRIERMDLASARTLLREPNLRLPPDRTTVHVLMASAYLPRSDSNAALLEKIDAGIASDVSIGFSALGRADVIDPGTQSRIAERLLGPGEAREASLVWLGAQPGARAMKSAQEPNMNQIELLKAALGVALAPLLDSPDALRKALDAGKAAEADAQKYRAITNGLGDHVKYLDDLPGLRTLIQDGATYKASLIDQLVASDRLAGVLGDTEDEVKAARADYEGMPTAALKRLADKAEKAAKAPETTGRIEPSEPGRKQAPNPTQAIDGLDFLK